MWANFIYEDESNCVVDQYKVTITDPNGLKTIQSYGIGESPSTEPDSDTGGYGELLDLDSSRSISIADSSFTEISKLVYYGDYTIEI